MLDGKVAIVTGASRGIGGDDDYLVGNGFSAADLMMGQRAAET
jgi:NADP-dependent 3-hydroxy acid dehydrogenase YdfG